MSGSSDGRDVPPDKVNSININLDTATDKNLDVLEVEMKPVETMDSITIPVDKCTETKTTTNITNPTKPIRLYEERDLGPYCVFIESKSTEGAGISRIHPMSIGKILNESSPDIYNNILAINRTGRNRIKVETRLGIHANALVNSEILKSKNFVVYIPQFMLERKGVLRGIDTNLSDEDILRHAKTLYSETIPVVAVRRFKRKILNKETRENEYKPTGTVLITFRGQFLPNYICIHHVRCEVHKYIQSVLQCHNCFRYGHTTAQCKSTSPRCIDCGEKHTKNECTPGTLLKCIHCKGNHSSLAKDLCPEYVNQKKIKELMATQNLTYLESKNHLEGKSYSWAVLRQTAESFPTLDHALNKNFIKKNNSSISSKISVNKRVRVASPDKHPANDLYLQAREITNSYSTPLYPSDPLLPNNNFPKTKPHGTLHSKPTNANQISEVIFSIVTSIISNKNFTISEEEIKNMVKDRSESLQF